MFGHQDDNSQPQPAQAQAEDWPPVGQSAPATDTQNDSQQGDAPQDQPGTPLLDEHAEDGQPADQGTFADVSSHTPGDDTPGDNSNDLLDIKQQALQQLSPLVGHLDQTPEEKFRTTMMMIQASDDQNLIKTAYESAQAITDEKLRAQALLDVINEINYFTHKDTD